jgi:hypothetical protein
LALPPLGLILYLINYRFDDVRSGVNKITSKLPSNNTKLFKMFSIISKFEIATRKSFGLILITGESR